MLESLLAAARKTARHDGRPRPSLLAAILLACCAAAAGAQETLTPGTMQARVAACTGCHGAEGRAGPDGYYPRLAGKPRAYLLEQLQGFRDGRRAYEPMRHLLAGLPDAYLDEIAGYFSDQHPPYPPPPRAEAGAAALEQGRRLVVDGDAARGLPACAACHGSGLNGMAPAISGLLGLRRDYLVSQLGGWRSGLRRASDPDCMGEIAQRLTPEDIGAVSAWLAAQPVPEAYRPGPPSAQPLPLECGSQARALGERP